MNIKNITLFILILLLANPSWARENIGVSLANKPIKANKETMDCNEATAQIDLAINNVRARLLTGGDLWWDPVSTQPHYEVPRVPPGSDQPSIHSIFAGALWIGGIDQLNQLKVAGQTYRQTGNDFWPGPLGDDGETAASTCSTFDRFWVVFGRDIDEYLGKLEEGGGTVAKGDVPESILQWPGRENPFFTNFDLPINKTLAPFWDADGDEIYDPTKGDYPVIDPEVEGVYADQMIWWIFNDKGNIHTETGGEAIGLEVNALAFAFATNDEVNNMTFYKYIVDNKSTQRLDSVYFGQWVDPDLGAFDDDYVGCDPDEEVGFVYNGNSNDAEYGSKPPILGVDFFKGPKKFETRLDGTIDTIIQGMSAFVYYNNDGTVQGNPDNASHFYGYLAGVWKDGTPFTFGGIGKGGDTPTPYMFPDEPSDPEGWSECTNGNEPDDRRFLQSSGPFQLEPGAVNDIIVGAVWVQEGLEYPCPSLEVFLRADKKAQALFDNNFKLKDGPDAPSMTIRELDRELIITLWNDSLISNNAFEQYEEVDPVLAKQGFQDSTYTFQGYKLYQVSGPTVSPSEFGDADKARLISIVDIRDGISRLINYEQQGALGLVPIEKVNGLDEGVQHTFKVTDDLFALGARTLVNNKKYYFSVVAYGYNAHTPYSLEQSETAQLEPYIEGRNNINVYVGIPHISTPEGGGTVLNAAYGDGPEITLIQGIGNGANCLSLTDQTITDILSSSSHKVDNPVYIGGAGPVGVRIFDPLNVPANDFELQVHNRDFASVTQPSNGSVTVNSDGTVTYNPNGGFEGYDAFTYEITDVNCDSDLATVLVKVGNPQVSSIIAFDNSVMTTKHVDDNSNIDSLAAIITVSPLNNDFAPEGVTININNITTPPDNGEILEFSAADGTITYIPDQGFEGLDKFSYSVTDSTFLTTPSGTEVLSIAIATVYVKVTGNSSPTEAVDDIVEVSGSQALSILENDNGINVGSETLTPYARWTLTNKTTGEVYKSENNIKKPNEQAIGGWEETSLGFYVNVSQTLNPSSTHNGFIDADLSFEQPQNRWLTLITDGESGDMFNWIRAGEYIDANNGSYNDNRFDANSYYDPEQYYETILDGQVAPYCLTNNKLSTTGGSTIAPACSDCEGSDESGGSTSPTYNLEELPSFRLVLTADKSHWTKCIVVDIGTNQSITEGGATKNGLRRHASWNMSVDGSGNPVYSDPMTETSLQPNWDYFVGGTSASYIEYTNSAGETRTIPGNTFFKADDISGATNFARNNSALVYKSSDVGYSWFPGYAINMENGERLNIIFSENSFLGGDNGLDMLWNPTDVVFSPNSGISGNNLRIGGEHYIYVTNTLYDEGVTHHDKLVQAAILKDKEEDILVYGSKKREVYDEVMWVTAPLLTPTFELTSFEEGYIPTTVTMNVKVGRSYEEPAPNEPLIYQFSFNDYATQQTDAAVAKEALDLIRIVPNPYYAFSTYEASQLDNRVRITNLPARANISIMTVDGNLVRTIKADNTGLDTALGAKAGEEQINSVDWDVKNFKNLPIASGLYLIHIEAPDLGEERTLKWFCINRPVDLDIF